MNEEMMLEYDQNLASYEKFKSDLESMLNGILGLNDFHLKAISSRVKARESLLEKIERKNGYQSLDSITDIVGVRIVTYYDDYVEKIIDVISQNFVIDNENSVNKSDLLDSNEFGYKSSHLVVSLSESRLNLTEYSCHRGYKAEIQVRSVLQDAWAEVEHGLGYKSAGELPSQFRRKFSRLAGLFELADEEFIDIRTGIESYKKFANSEIENNILEVAVNRVTLESYVKHSEVIKQLDLKISEIEGRVLTDNVYISSYLINALQYFNIETIQVLENQLNEHSDLIIKFSEYSQNQDNASKNLAPTVCLFKFFKVLASKDNDQKLMQDFAVFAVNEKSIKALNVEDQVRLLQGFSEFMNTD